MINISDPHGACSRLACLQYICLTIGLCSINISELTGQEKEKRKRKREKKGKGRYHERPKASAL